MSIRTQFCSGRDEREAKPSRSSPRCSARSRADVSSCSATGNKPLLISRGASMAKKSSKTGTPKPPQATTPRPQPHPGRLDRVVAGADWERLATAAVPLLQRESPETLTDEDIARLVQATRVDGDDVRLWINAYRLAAAQPLTGEPDRVAALDWQAYYAWLRNGIDDLFAVSTPTLATTVSAAISTGVVPKDVAGLLDRLSAVIE